MKTCGHCGLVLTAGYGTVDRDGRVVRLCHTGALGRPDCYRRVTVYCEPLGVLKTVFPLPSGVENVVDPVWDYLRGLYG